MSVLDSHLHYESLAIKVTILLAGCCPPLRRHRLPLPLGVRPFRVRWREGRTTTRKVVGAERGRRERRRATGEWTSGSARASSRRTTARRRRTRGGSPRSRRSSASTSATTPCTTSATARSACQKRQFGFRKISDRSIPCIRRKKMKTQEL